MDFTEEFNKVFSNACPPKTDWNKERYFDALNNDCYSSETALLSSLTSEAYNYFGFEVIYFIKEMDLNLDPLLGEDQLENIRRRFPLKVYSENIPNLQKQYQLQGMIYTEIVTVQCTILHFNEASKLDWNTNTDKYDSVIPKIGDIMYFKWCDLYYEVLNVKTFAEGSSFLGTPITYSFNLRVWKNVHENVDENNENNDIMNHLRSFVELGETFNVNNNNPISGSSIAASGDILSINDNLKIDKESQILFKKSSKNKTKTNIDPFIDW